MSDQSFDAPATSRAYCEWLEPGSRWLLDWGEPLNTVTNVGFLLVGLWAFLTTVRGFSALSWARWDYYWLSALIFLIGCGSWLFHQTQQYVLADVIPIVLMLNSYLAVWAVRATPWHLFGRKWPLIPVSFIALMVTSIAIPLALSWLGAEGSLLSSSGYFGAWLFLFGLGLYSFRRHGLTELLWASGLFALSLLFRTLDLPTCDLTSGQGLHTLWHFLNAVCFFLAMRFLFRLELVIR